MNEEGQPAACTAAASEFDAEHEQPKAQGQASEEARREAQELLNFSEAFAFIGNSLLKPMSQTEEVGLEPAFWAQFPDFGDERVTAALAALGDFAVRAQERQDAGENMVERVSVEYTKLFIGPPRPAAAPWETFYRGDGHAEAAVGFGQATFEMRELLRQNGLAVSNENNQYADHMGIELLLLSVLARRAADAAAASCVPSAAGDAQAPHGARAQADAGLGAGVSAEADSAACDSSDGAGGLSDGEAWRDTRSQAQAFAVEKPGSWVGQLAEKVGQAYPDGYVARLLELEEALIRRFSI